MSKFTNPLITGMVVFAFAASDLQILEYQAMNLAIDLIYIIYIHIYIYIYIYIYIHTYFNNRP